MGKCTKCGKPATISIEYIGKNYCESCFAEFLEKKVLSALRGNLPSNGRVGFDTSTLGGKVVMHIVKPYAIKARNECIEISATKKVRDLNLILTGETLDDINADTLAYILGVKQRLRESGFVNPLMKCTDKEVYVYAKIKGIHIKSTRQDSFTKLLKEELDKLERRYPGTKLSLLKTREYLLSLMS